MSGCSARDDAAVEGLFDLLLAHLHRLDRYQLERFKLGLRCPRLQAAGTPQVPWASLKAAGPAELLWLLREHFPGQRAWDIALWVSEDLRLTALHRDLLAQVDEMAPASEDPGEAEEPEAEPGEAPTELSVHRGRHRVRLKARLLARWDAAAWPEGHIYLRAPREQEHRELRGLLRPGAAPGAVTVLHGPPGAGKSTLAARLALHWAEGLLCPGRFDLAFFLSGHRVRAAGRTTLAGLLAGDGPPDARAAVERALGRPGRLLLVLDGLEAAALPGGEDGEDGEEDGEDGEEGRGGDGRRPAPALVRRLLRGELLREATLLATARDWHLGELRRLCPRARCRPVPGFSEADRDEYFRRFFRDRETAAKVSTWVRKHEALAQACCAPLVCWAVCTGLQRQLARRPSSWLDAQTPTGLYACLFARLPEEAAAGWSLPRWAEQWRALGALAARGLWACRDTLPREEAAGRLRAPLLRGLLRLGLLRPAADCGACLAFAHPSLQAFLAALFYVTRGPAGALGGLPKPRELRALLAEALVDANPYWRQTALFVFGLLNGGLAGQVEGALRCPLAPRAADELARWAEELSGGAGGGGEGAPYGFRLPPWFQCLHEAREEALAGRLLGHLREADLALGDPQLRAAAFCLRLCRGLGKLRLAVGCRALQTEPAAGARPGGSTMRQWQDICSVFHFGHVTELDLSDSRLGTAAMRKLCYELRSPRCRLQRLTCRAITPVRALKELVQLLHGNARLTHLDLSANRLGPALSSALFRTLRHSACRLQCLWLESCGLGPAACRGLCQELGRNGSLRFLSLADSALSGLEANTFPQALGAAQCALRELSLEQCGLSGAQAEAVCSVLCSAQRTTRLCLAFNPLRDEGLGWLCASLGRPGCTLRRLVLCCCDLGAPSGRLLAEALLESQGLTHLSLRMNRLGDEGVHALSEALGSARCGLRSLDLSQCSFGEGGCWVLAEALGRNACLKVLDVGGNPIGDAGGRRLFETLKRPCCILNTLGMESCGLTSASCKDLASALGVRRSLEHLNLLGNDLGREGVGTLWASLQKPSCRLQRLGLERDLHRVVDRKLQELQEKGRSLRILSRWDFNEPEDKWWW